jgi:dipeptidyl aminopeptidase/acylaminoacyl peptidase
MKLTSFAISIISLSFFIGCSEQSAPEETESKIIKIGEGLNVAWAPDNSAITACGITLLDADVSKPGMEYLYYLKTTAQRQLRKQRLGEVPRVLNYHAWSNDASTPQLVYSTAATSGWYSLLKIYDPQSGASTQLLSWPHHLRWPSWTADNDKIVFSYTHPLDLFAPVYKFVPPGLWYVNADGSGGIQAIPIDSEAIFIYYSCCLSNESSVLFVGDLDQWNTASAQNVFKISIDGGEPIQLTDFNDPETTIVSAAISPDGGSLAYTKGTVGSEDFMSKQYPDYIEPPRVYLQALPDGEPVELTSSNHEAFPLYLRAWLFLGWSPDGDKLVVSTYAYDKTDIDKMKDQNIYVVPVNGSTDQ